jgi:hypothetical protein
LPDVKLDFRCDLFHKFSSPFKKISFTKLFGGKNTPAAQDAAADTKTPRQLTG